jgi:hypothetical protein
MRRRTLRLLATARLIGGFPERHRDPLATVGTGIGGTK